jgi:hypothetical protein
MADPFTSAPVKNKLFSSVFFFFCDEMVWKLVKFTEEWSFTLAITTWTKGKFTNERRDWEENAVVQLMPLVFSCRRLKRVLRLRNSSVRVSGAISELALMELHLKWISIMDRSCRGMMYAQPKTCSSINRHQRFRGTYCIHSQDNYFTLKMETAGISETVVSIYETTGCYILEHHISFLVFFISLKKII